MVLIFYVLRVSARVCSKKNLDLILSMCLPGTNTGGTVPGTVPVSVPGTVSKYCTSQTKHPAQTKLVPFQKDP